MRREVVTLAGPFLLLRRYAHRAQRPDRRLVEQPLREVGTRCVHARSCSAGRSRRPPARPGARSRRLRHSFARVDTTLDAARRDHAAPDPVLSTLVVEDVARAELAEAEEPRPLDGVGLIARGNQRPKRQAREVVARDEALAREVAVRVELGSRCWSPGSARARSRAGPRARAASPPRAPLGSAAACRCAASPHRAARSAAR